MATTGHKTCTETRRDWAPKRQYWTLIRCIWCGQQHWSTRLSILDLNTRSPAKLSSTRWTDCKLYILVVYCMEFLEEIWVRAVHRHLVVDEQYPKLQ